MCQAKIDRLKGKLANVGLKRKLAAIGQFATHILAILGLMSAIRMSGCTTPISGVSDFTVAFETVGTVNYVYGENIEENLIIRNGGSAPVKFRIDATKLICSSTEADVSERRGPPSIPPEEQVEHKIVVATPESGSCKIVVHSSVQAGLWRSFKSLDPVELKVKIWDEFPLVTHFDLLTFQSADNETEEYVQVRSRLTLGKSAESGLRCFVVLGNESHDVLKAWSFPSDVLDVSSNNETAQWKRLNGPLAVWITRPLSAFRDIEFAFLLRLSREGRTAVLESLKVGCSMRGSD